ncbi:short-chain dehydrogenase/reductase [Rouxiella silvae]|uniref:Short-chain dehydrogenase/reductase n=1 Tax=Rouxiella silvae TaxID=1646373 RepID=A0ABX3TZZ3_9GAMM|nr:SDR family oxidoreductase [Rouxiella silvae]KQN46597.1 dehydrogenase [Serratia sp. Leaf50]ORJ20804.1 short-chain dehydrogenase/reductase [Rouxiella silvae]
MKTVLITGCSSGFGLETAGYFLKQGWKVIATMRTPREDLLPRSEHLRLLALDVTDAESIHHAVEAAGPIDALVNNAGIGLLSAIEGTSMDLARDIFNTNTFGTMALCKAFIPQFRQRKSGVIINVTSTVTLKPIPLLAVYTASKAAVNAFTESLALELAPFNIRVGLVLPGLAPSTDFGKNAASRMQNVFPEPYEAFAANFFANAKNTAVVTYAADVAHAVWQAVNDPSAPMRIPAGADAVALAAQSL